MNGLFRYGAAVFCAAFIIILAGCSSSDEQTQTQTPWVNDYDIYDDIQTYDGTPKSITIKPKDGKSGGAVTAYYDGSKTAPSEIGSYKVTFDVAAAPGWNAVKNLDAGTMKIKAGFSPENVITLTFDAWASGSITGANDTQWYKFIPTKIAHYIHFNPGTLSSVYIDLFKSNGEALPVYYNHIRLYSDELYKMIATSSDNLYYIRVTAYSGSGTFKIAFNDSIIQPVPAALPTEDVTQLIADTWSEGTRAFSGGEKWFKFTATADNQYIHILLGSENTPWVSLNMQLYDTDGGKVGLQSSFSLNYSNNPFSQTLISGNEYYIKITSNNYSTGYLGEYKLGFTASYTQAPDKATLPTSNITPLIADTWTNGNLAQNEEKWFKFTAAADTQYVHFDPETLTSVWVRLYDAAGTPLEWDPLLETTPNVSWTVTSGNEYYIRATTFDVGGTYKLAVNSSITQPLVILPDFNVTTLSADIWEGSYIDKSTGYQWYKFTATADTQFIHFLPETLNAVNLKLFDAGGRNIDYQYSLTNTTRYLSYKLTSGNEYYIRVTSYKNSGEFKLAFNTLFLPPNTDITAISADNIWADFNITGSNRELWLKFTATANTQYIHFEQGTLTGVYAQVYNSTGATVGSQANLSNNSYQNVTVTSGNEYYIKVTPSRYDYNGEFKIGITTSTTRPSTVILPSNAIVLNAGIWEYGSIDSSIGYQWFKFTATADTQYIHFAPGSLNGASIQLYTSAGATEGSQIYLPGTILFASITLTRGVEYYMRVMNLNATGTYSIEFNELPVSPDAVITSLTADTWANGNIAAQYQEQWFKLTATADSHFIHFTMVSLNSLSNVYVQAYNSTGTTVGERINLTTSALYKTLQFTPGNEYYIRVISNTYNSNGSYKIAFNGLPIPPGTTITTINAADIWFGGNTSYVEWFKFTATADIQYIHFRPGTLTNMNVQLYNSAGAETGNETNLTSSVLYTSRTLKSGDDYYIKVTPGKSESGNYGIAFNGLFLPPGTTATSINTNKWENNILSSSGSQWLKFTASAATQYIHFDSSLYSPTLFNVSIKLYDAGGAAVGNGESLGITTGYHPYTSRTLTIGKEYYIEVGSSSGGNYCLLINNTSLPYESVTQLSAGTWASGNISYNSPHKEQWFKFTATASSQFIYLTLPGTIGGLSVQLYDSAGITVGSSQTWNNSTYYILRTVTVNNEYYIKVRDSSNESNYGSYRIGFTATTSPPAN